MRKYIIAAAAIALLSSTGLVTQNAQAMTLAAPGGVRAAAEGTDLVQEARWVCRYYWNGRRCWWEPNHRRWWWRHHRHRW